MLKNKVLLAELHERMKSLASLGITVKKKNGECVVTTKGVKGNLFICFQFLSKGSYLDEIGGYFLIKCWDFEGEYELHPENLFSTVIYWSQLEKEEYDILTQIKSNNSCYLTSGFEIEREYPRFIQNAAIVHYWNIDDFHRILDFLVEYTPKLISRHLHNPQFPLLNFQK